MMVTKGRKALEGIAREDFFGKVQFEPRYRQRGQSIREYKGPRK
jgi:hypothetical protein